MITPAAERGFLLVAAVVLIALGALMALAIATLTAGGALAGAEQIVSARAFYAAETGLERAMYGYSRQGAACAGLAYSGSAGNASYSTSGVRYDTSSLLPSAMDTTQTYVPIAAANLASYADFGQVIIGAERINYGRKSTSAADCGGGPSCLAGAQRGAGGTLASTHAIGASVTQGQCLIASTGTVSAAGAARVVRAAVPGLIGFDAQSSGTGNNIAILTWPHTVSGTNRILIVGVSIRNNNNQTVTGVTYAGLPLTTIGFRNNATNVRMELWRLVAPPIGTNFVAVNLSAAARVVGGAVSLTGVDQTDPIDAAFVSNIDNSNAPTVSITTVTNNAWVIDTVAVRGNITLTVGAGQTQRWNRSVGGGANRVNGAGSTEGPRTPPGAVTMSWTAGGTQRWAIGAVALKPAPMGASVLYWQERF